MVVEILSGVTVMEGLNSMVVDGLSDVLMVEEVLSGMVLEVLKGVVVEAFHEIVEEGLNIAGSVALIDFWDLFTVLIEVIEFVHVNF